MADIVKDAHARLHFDPVMYLPQEIISTILEYADPNTLISAAIVSRAWKQRSSEPRLWRRLFVQEGWIYDSAYLERFETNARRQIRSLQLLDRSQTTEDTSMDTDEQDTIFKRIGNHQGPIRLWTKNARLGIEKPLIQSERSGYTTDRRRSSIVSHDETMDGVTNTTRESSGSQPSQRIYTPLLESDNLLNRGETLRFDWKYLYKQRRLLEENWNAGRYTNFRLPRHDHPEEAHTQCVYTMQFSNKHVVTGSRDRTVRIWDLETKRLKLKPLTGHRGSVLCLQFDETPSQDVLVSGGSDTDVIIWVFSTGHMFKRLKNAHSDSVLNLCFDHRYLVTCSKDKTIKLWNRRGLLPTDSEYPPSNRAKDAEFPEYIINLPDMISSAALNRIQPLERYSLVMTLNGHNAAVNAIQIHDDQIVSASGDRKIFLWSISQGQLLRQFSGHTKGIACVQYDGKRIVSGSSDRTVRIFDGRSGAELAVLAGHRELVRTVQADFADAPGSEEAYAAQARAHDQEIAQLKRAGKLKLGMSLATGADLPPGGGGNEWSKIVSGSYDETVMIWKKGRRGKWNVIRELRQEDAMRMTSSISPLDRMGQDLSTPPAGPPDNLFMPPRESLADGNEESARTSTAARAQATEAAREVARQRFQAARAARVTSSTASTPRTPAVEDDNHGDHVMSRVSEQPQTHTPAHLNPQHPLFAYSAPPRADISGVPSAASRPAMTRVHPDTSARTAQTAFSGHQSQLTQPLASSAGLGVLQQAPRTIPATSTFTSATSQPQPPPQAPTTATTTIITNTVSVPQPNPTQPDPQAEAQTHPHRHRARAPVDDDLIGASRVFKLQFSSRFIICCSQQPVIVGWDFANGERELEEASAFFGMPKAS